MLMFVKFCKLHDEHGAKDVVMRHSLLTSHLFRNAGYNRNAPLSILTGKGEKT
jgi:hypothetical protein